MSKRYYLQHWQNNSTPNAKQDTIDNDEASTKEPNDQNVGRRKNNCFRRR